MLQTTAVSSEPIQPGATTAKTVRRKRESSSSGDNGNNHFDMPLNQDSDSPTAMQHYPDFTKRLSDNESSSSASSSNHSFIINDNAKSNSSLQSTQSIATEQPSSNNSTPKRRKLDRSSSYFESILDDCKDQSEYHTSSAYFTRHTRANSLPAESVTSRSKSYVCPYPGCGKAYAKPSRLAEHELGHSGERPFKCLEPGCGASFRREAHLTIHYKSQHNGIKEFICHQPGCGSAFYSQDKLTRHFKIHSELADPLLASTALILSAPASPTGSIFQRRSRTQSDSTTGAITPIKLEELPSLSDILKSQRRMSMSSEGGDRLADDIKSIRPYACTWGGCLKRFKKHRELKAHVCIVHEGRKPYPCPVDRCDKSFQTPSKLRKHSLQHTETKRYVCAYPDCGEYFTKWSLLQKHTKISHKTSKCEICGKAILKKNLSAHVKIHDASRPEVPCTVEGCQKVFSTERTLATHIKTAHPSSPADTQRFECTFDNCGQSFSFKHVLKRHIRNIHTLPKAGPTKQRNDMLEFDVIDELAGLNEEDEMIKLPFVCEILGCNRRYSTKALLKRHLKSSIHKSDGMKGLAALEAMEQEENQAIQEIIALHLDPTLNK